MRTFLAKYDWIKISGILGILLLDTLVVISIISLFSSCADKSKAAQVTDKGIATVQNPYFTLPLIPETITDEKARAQYLVAHYWDNVDLADTTFIRSANHAEQAFVDYIALFPHTTTATAALSIGGTLEKSRSTEAVYEWFTDMYEKYLYDPNSPMRDEEYYAMALEYILKSETDETSKIRPAFQLEEINKNRKGNIAADFRYITAQGEKGTLHSVKSEYTLLLFYNPGCGDCKRTKSVLEQSQLIAGLVDVERLKIVALYPDNDLTEWKDYQSAIPENWINALDASKDEAIKGRLYAIRAIPSLYLLDRDKRVMLKDASVEQVLTVLQYGQ